MVDTRTRALNTVRHFRISPKRIERLKHERTLYATGAPLVWPAEAVARYCMRVALENGCTTIAVCQGRHSPQYFDVMSLISYSRSLMPHGQLAVPKMKVVPPDL